MTTDATRPLRLLVTLDRLIDRHIAVQTNRGTISGRLYAITRHTDKTADVPTSLVIMELPGNPLRIVPWHAVLDLIGTPAPTDEELETASASARRNETPETGNERHP